MAENGRPVAGDLIIAADFGTSGVKVGLVDPDFRIVARTTISYPLSLPAPSQAEQNPEDWWTAFGAAIRQLSAQVANLPERAAGIVFAAQMCGLVCADANGVPLRPCLIWLDKRSAALTRATVGGFPSVVGYQAFGLLRWIRLANGAPSLNGMDPTGKMLWMRDHERDVFARSHKLLDVKDWLVHRATGVFATTADSANLTWLMDTRPGREGWSQVLADSVGLPLDKMPAIVDGASVVGGLTARAAAELGLSPGTPLVGGAGDVTATAIGSGAVEDGALHICAGTSSWVSGFFPRRILRPFDAYATILSSVGCRPLLIATQENAGSAFGWAARLLDEAGGSSPENLAALYADPGAPQADDPFFLPWLAGERVPVDDDRLRGAFYGLSLRHDRKASLRAVAEGVALNTRWAYRKVAAEKGVRLEAALPLVGGAAKNGYFAQMLADAIDRPICVAEPEFAGVRGAAAIAAPALNWTPTVWEAAAHFRDRAATLYHPRPAEVERLDARYRRLETIRKALIRLDRRGSHNTGARASP